MITADNALLRIKRIRQSRHGAFCIADLITDFGEFKVKDPLLDQFEEGEYEATVWISEIFLSQYIAYGKGVTELRARITDLQVHTEDQHQIGERSIELDPLDEPVITQVLPAQLPTARSGLEGLKQKLAKPRSPEIHTVPAPVSEDSIYDADTLSAIERGEPVKLDPSIDRARLREQTAGLKARGYRFDPKQQTWFAT